METLEQFIAKQEAELEKKKRELQEFAQLGPIPGLTPWLLHGKLYGYRSVGFKLVDIKAFLEWAKVNCMPIFAIEGRYKVFKPSIPDTADYRDATVAATGAVVIDYSTIMRKFTVEVYVPGYKIMFDVSGGSPDLIPIPVVNGWYGEKIKSWKKPLKGVRQYLRAAIDNQSADLETLLTWEQFEQYFVNDKVEA